MQRLILPRHLNVRLCVVLMPTYGLEPVMKIPSMKPYFNYTLVVIASLVATLFFSQKAYSYNNLRHEPRVEIRAGVSGYPIISQIATDGLFPRYYEAEPAIYGGGDLLRNMYRDYRGDLRSMGNFHVAAGYRFKGWFTLSGYFMYNQMWQHLYDGSTEKITGTEFSHIISLAPEAKFTFLNKRYVQLYGSVSAGVTLYKSADAAFMEFDLLPHIQLVPFGVSTGRRFFGFTEFGFGSEFVGLRAGMGIRF